MPAKKRKDLGDEVPKKSKKVGENSRSRTLSFCKLFWGFLFLFVLGAGTIINIALNAEELQRDCPSCVCSTPLRDSNITIGSLRQKLETKDIGFATFSNNFIENDALRMCAVQCYNNFYVCPDKTDVEKCKEHTSIPRGCSNFDKCISECKDDCPTRNGPGSGLDDNVCVNKFNYGLLCPN